MLLRKIIAACTVLTTIALGIKKRNHPLIPAPGWLRNCLKYTFFTVTLFTIPLSITVVNVLENKSISNFFYYHFSNEPTEALTIFIICALISFAAMLIGPRESDESGKMPVSILLFILASASVAWQLSMGLHLFFEPMRNFAGSGVPCSWLGLYPEAHRQSMGMDGFRLAIQSGFLLLTLLFFPKHLIGLKKRRANEMRSSLTGSENALHWAGSGFLFIAVSYLLPFWIAEGITLFPGNTGVLIMTVMLSFTSILGPLLLVSLAMICIGGVSVVKKSNKTTPSNRIKTFSIVLMAALLYIFLFKSLWPWRDPAPTLLLRTA
ncbi:MAG: hypothetical protein GY765_15790, partial [bacterium]|nr:hypothetical protein [bacterium]